MIEFQTVWGWQVFLYLFLSGLGSGAFFSAAVLSFAKYKRHRKTVSLCFWISVAFIALGTILLVTELVHPDRIFAWSLSFSHLSSWMTRGAWGLAASFVVFSLVALLSMKTTVRFVRSLWGLRPHLIRLVRKILLVLGCLLALFLMGYTGVLLANAPGIPFWNSWLLPMVFVVSAITAGGNLIVAVAVLSGSAHKVPKRKRSTVVVSLVVLTAFEGIALAIYLSAMMNGGGFVSTAQQVAAEVSAHRLVVGDRSLAFWGLVVGCGIILPLVLSMVSVCAKKTEAFRLIVLSSACAIAGECALRFLILDVGAYADYIIPTLAGVL